MTSISTSDRPKIDETSFEDPYAPTLPPTQDELPYDDDISMETQRHKLQMDLLIEVLYPWLENREDGYVGGNMFVYFSLQQVRDRDFRGPDFFAVVGVPKTERKSWVVWEEGKAPDVVIELLSESTAQADKTKKKRIYQERLRVPEYFWYDPFDAEDWAGFILRDGQYEPMERDENDRFWSERLGLWLVKWQGTYGGVNATWLRWETPDGVLLRTGWEEATLAHENLDRAQQEATQARARAERLAARLQDLGIDPEELS